MKAPHSHKVATVLFSTAILLTASGVTNSHHAIASSSPAICYQIPAKGNPFNGKSNKTVKEIWCYKELSERPGAKLIYGIDEKGKTQPEMSMIAEANGTIFHASLSAGKISYHRMKVPGLNPLGAPLAPPANAIRVPTPMGPSADGSVDQNIETYWEHENIPVQAGKVQEGEFVASVAEESLPWKGYWYPYSTQRMHDGLNSPMAKYDRFVARRAAATNPGSQEWEKQHHVGGRSWSGHCNGWAAASVLVPEPRQSITDPFTGITFTPFDLKALHIERNYCPKLVFYGSRNYGEPDDVEGDIYASTFHNVLTYFIGELKKPVLTDLMRTVPVQNAVMSGYKMSIKKVDTNSFQVEARVRVHLYEDKANDDHGVARSVTKTYKYTLHTDSEGTITSGTWHSANPDFLWVAIAKGNCGDDRNQLTDQFWLDEIERFKPSTQEPQPPPTIEAPGEAPETSIGNEHERRI